MNSDEFWLKEFGDIDSVYDFAGIKILRNEYNTASPYAWKISRIQPNDIDNRNHHIVNVTTDAKKMSAQEFVIDERTYGIKARHLVLNDVISEYDYTDKKFCIVILKDVEEFETQD